MSTFNFDSVIGQYYTDDESARVKGMHIGLAGAGGLGSNCAVFLARAGFRRFTIVDHDTVEISNLNRQTYTHTHLGRPKVDCLAEVLRAINPEATIEAVRTRLDRSTVVALLGSCDAVVEALDTPDTKAMVVEELAPTGTMLVCASGIAGAGNSDSITTSRLRPNLYVVGDRVSDTEKGERPLAPRVALAAAKQADVVLAWTLGGASTAGE